MNFYQSHKSSKVICYSSNGKPYKKWESLPPGLYKVWDMGNMLVGFVPGFEMQKKQDELVEFETGVMGEVLEKMDKFFSDEVKAKYKQLGIVHKMGIALYGKPGVGKTALARLAMLKAVSKYDAICLDFTKHSISIVRYVVQLLREHTKAPIIAFVDECEKMLRADEALTYLDGGDSVETTIFIGATNFQDKIPDRIINRKSRIKYAFGINSLPTEVYKKFILDKIPDIKKEDHAKFAYLAEEDGLTIDQLKNALINFHIDSMGIHESIKEVQSHVEVKTPKDEEFD